MSEITSAQFENFEKAFRGRVSGCRRTCECGIEFYDNYNHGYDWNEGELEGLEEMVKQGTAKALDHSVGVVEFEGRYYVDGCDCWHPRAKRIAAFIIDHDEAIADFLSAERRRKMAEAVSSPVVGGDQP